jgi:hypothetical protein
MRLRIFATISLALLSGACQGAYQSGTNTSAPYGDNAARACADYGFRSGTAAYNQCVSREQAARASGRTDGGYATAQLTADARNTCGSYGLAIGSPAYEQCVAREMDARSRRAAAPAAYRTDQYGYRIDAQGYRVDANGYRMASQPQYSPQAGYPYGDQQTPRDAYGYRYDSQGNRIDASGRVVPTQYRY